MARLTLTTPGEDVTIGGTVSLVGTRTGGEVITVTGGNISLDASFNAGGDTIVLPGDSGTYTVRLVGSQAIIASSGVTVSIPLGTAGTSIQFADTTLSLLINTSTGAATLGGQTITATAAPVNGEGSAATTLTLDDDTVIGAASTVIQNVDAVILGSGRGEVGEDGHTYDITLENDNAPPNGGVLTIDGSALAADTDGAGPLTEERLLLGASSVTGFGLSITGGTGADIIIGGAQADQISGGAGTDLIRGNRGADILTGGNGTDFFFYNDEEDSSISFGRDTITDFLSGTDFIIGISFELFLNLGNASNLANATALLTAGDGWIDVVFQQDQHLLWADIDDDGILSASDVSIFLPTVSTLADDTRLVSPHGTGVITEWYEDDDTIVELDRSQFLQLADDPNLTDPSALSVELRGVISDNNDIDGFAIFLEAGETITLDVDGAYNPSDPSALDSIVAVYNVAGDELAGNDDADTLDTGSTSPLDSYLVFQAPVSGTYYVTISSFNNGTPGGSPEDYHLLLSITGG